MRKHRAITMLLAAISWSCSSQLHADCLAPDAVLKLDATYEEALRIGDVKLLDSLLAPEYSWVHNLASLTEDKTGLLARLQKPGEIPKARRSHDIRSHRLGDTVVLQGLSSVEKWNPDGKTYRTSRYQFMRTYVRVGETCQLLGVQTMKVWSSDGQ
ncbi:nuclear transport factor 2 family protein [Cellvibrio japonicus]|uniref:Putative lipoprotein n=1 Tax=Cellvibrio japonicus (strain Ueda107) TaxID=498211 RepID=B3PI44_CELJU|nr:nuclear transport factor 2 family protein [Cellvibrio japonicus]ACE85020.1 putative lipoprotein [Cellvibrio japonicus Ueda107]QEI11093.1 nuclear transport factor 2 family protein [Cellvibrio japonicus]QEI14667.1 nuclear transport factor 2 family protein [Cellvibrio japonicus]QEI18247.1 nuclear transport factor 2 family protein [Cellvibrio japonicus]